MVLFSPKLWKLSKIIANTRTYWAHKRGHMKVTRLKQSKTSKLNRTILQTNWSSALNTYVGIFAGWTGHFVISEKTKTNIQTSINKTKQMVYQFTKSKSDSQHKLQYIDDITKRARDTDECNLWLNPVVFQNLYESNQNFVGWKHEKLCAIISWKQYLCKCFRLSEWANL